MIVVVVSLATRLVMSLAVGHKGQDYKKADRRLPRLSVRHKAPLRRQGASGIVHPSWKRHDHTRSSNRCLVFHSTPAEEMGLWAKGDNIHHNKHNS
jgi:hypothetical protein